MRYVIGINSIKGLHLVHEVFEENINLKIIKKDGKSKIHIGLMKIIILVCSK